MAITYEQTRMIPLNSDLTDWENDSRLYYRILHRSTALLTITAIIFLSFLFNSTRFLELEATSKTVTACNSTITTTVYFILPTDLRLDPIYSSVSMLLSTILLNLAPLSALVFFNSRIRGVIKNRTKNKSQVSLTSLQ